MSVQNRCGQMRTRFDQVWSFEMRGRIPMVKATARVHFLSLLSIIYDSQRLTMHSSPSISLLTQISEAKPSEPQKRSNFGVLVSKLASTNRKTFLRSEARFWPKSSFEGCSAPNEVSVLSFFEPLGHRACTRAMF